MSFNWTDYLTIAHEMARLGTASPEREAWARSAISRAYYAAHHAAQQVAGSKDGYSEPLPGSGDVHKALARHFTQHPDPTRQQIGRDLDYLRSLRGKADYEPTLDPRILRDGPAFVQMADHLRAKLTTLSPPQNTQSNPTPTPAPPTSRIIGGIFVRNTRTRTRAGGWGLGLKADS